MFAPAVLAGVSLFALRAAAHGAVTSYTIDGVDYPGYDGYGSNETNPSGPSIQRPWLDHGPALSIEEPRLRCNEGSPAALSAPVAAGGVVTAKWQQQTHPQGPLMVWLYKCPGDFASCDGAGKGWFKIDQVGLLVPPLSGTYWGADVVRTTHQWTSTIPSSLEPGNYLIRHEVLTIHQPKSPQFYPECAQIVVSGTGTDCPGPKYLAKIPGYASPDDPGLTVDIYNTEERTYRPPGPPVWHQDD